MSAHFSVPNINEKGHQEHLSFLYCKGKNRSWLARLADLVDFSVYVRVLFDKYTSSLKKKTLLFVLSISCRFLTWNRSHKSHKLNKASAGMAQW